MIEYKIQIKQINQIGIHKYFQSRTDFCYGPSSTHTWIKEKIGTYTFHNVAAHT